MIRERKMIVAMPMGTSVGKENEINQNKKNGKRRREKVSGGGGCVGRLWVEWWQKEDEEHDGGASHPQKWEPLKSKETQNEKKKTKIRGERIGEPEEKWGRWCRPVREAQGENGESLMRGERLGKEKK